MSKGGSTQTVTQKADPWKPAQPYLKDLLGQADNQFQQGGQFAPFSTVVPFSNQTEGALTGLENFANAGGTPGINQSQSALSELLGGNQQLRDTAAGNYLNSNPYLDQMYQAASQPVMDQVNSYFSMGGRSGSDTQAGELAKQLGNLSANIYGQNYAQERQNQLGAAGTLGQQQLGGISQAGDVNQLAQSPLQTLLGVGQAREGQAGNQLQDLLNRWNYGQQQPWQNLQQYAGLLGGIGGAGGTGSTTQPSGSNLGDILGTGASLAGLGSTLGLFGGAGAAAGGATTAASLAPFLLMSDRNAKTDIKPVDADKVIEAFKAASAYSYRYKLGFGDNGAEWRIGPMAQDVNGGTVIPMPHEIGMLHAVVHALIGKIEALEARNGAR